MKTHKGIDMLTVRLTSDKELINRIKDALSTRPQLERTYRNKVKDIIRQKTDFQNVIIYYLASYDEYAITALDILESGLNLFEGKEGVENISARLVDFNHPSKFHSAYTELDLALYFRERGYSVKLSPVTKEGQNEADLRVYGAFEVTFEATSIWLNDFLQEHNIADRIRLGLQNFSEYILQLNFEKEFSELDIESFLNKAKKWLSSLLNDKSENIGEYYNYNSNSKNIATLKVIGKTDSNQGAIAIVIYPGYCKIGDSGLRAKLRKKQRQLNPEEKNVILMESTYPFQISNFAITNALIGNRQFDSKHEQYVRDLDRFFDLDNKDVSAILYLKRKKPKFVDCERIVYGNYFASNSIPLGFFSDTRRIELVEKKAGVFNLEEIYFKEFKNSQSEF